jgi:4'-phosphopantetheinyl transferase
MMRTVEMPLSPAGETPPSTPWPADGSVHLWSADLDDWAEAADAGEEELTAAERERAHRFVIASARRRYVAGRRWLRRVLGSYLGLPPRDVHFRTDHFGKPHLTAGAGAPHRLRFNLAHCGAAAQLAVTVDDDVGVDLEQPLPENAWPAVARRCCSPGELTVLASLPPHARALALAQIWTRKEAAGKALGRGLAPDILARPLGPAAWGAVCVRDAGFTVWSLPERGGRAAAIAVAK